jgi:hypothetical protein
MAVASEGLAAIPTITVPLGGDLFIIAQVLSCEDIKTP